MVSNCLLSLRASTMRGLKLLATSSLKAVLSARRQIRTLPAERRAEGDGSL